ncbi:MAG: flagellar biosynthetic protein FliQ [Balneolaceae bacterium]|nr:MAG: flagellar biosynthetic protein FliQ [Balneolaceae bacterium]
MNIDTGIYWLQEALKMTVVLSGPVLIAALVVGLVIAILQAATTIQEMTLSYIPKMVVVVVVLFLLFGFMLQASIDFTQRIFDFIPSIAK